jgi:hypothetical protein
MTTTSSKFTTEDAKGLLESLGHVGAAWARYGLTVARASLEAQAKLLDALAKGIGEVADRIDRRQEPVETAEARD